MKKHKSFCLLLLLCAVMLTTACTKNGEAEQQEAIHLTIISNDENLTEKDRYYFDWLEQELAVQINLNFVAANYMDEYLDALVKSQDEHNIDGVLFADDLALSHEELERYIVSDGIYQLNTCIEESALDAENEEIFSADIKTAISSEDGGIYYMPIVDNSQTAKTFQSLWINIAFLEDCGLSIPQDTVQLKEFLMAFQEYNPKGAPIIGSIESENTFAVNFLMNSFTICDPNNYYIAIQDGTLFYPPSTNAFRNGLRYCNGLYSLGLLVKENFTYRQNQLVSLCNDPNDYVGAFTSKSISDVLSAGSPALLSKYLAIAPTGTEKDNGYAIIEQPAPRVGGFILQSSKQKQKVFQLMQLMCSSDAFLRSYYGRPEIDWDTAEIGDVSVNGEQAKISVNNEEELSRGDETSAPIGPCITIPEYQDHVAWKGYQINHYHQFDARAYNAQREYLHTENLNMRTFAIEHKECKEELLAISTYTKEKMISFITGEWDINDDADWQAYLDGLDALHVVQLLYEIEELL